MDKRNQVEDVGFVSETIHLIERYIPTVYRRLFRH